MGSEYQSIRSLKYANLAHLDHKDDVGKLPPGIESLCWECYNTGKEEITFTTTHPLWRKMHFFGKHPREWAKFKCKPGEWVFVPHMNYILSVPSGAPQIQCLVNLGDAMFKGNKLPSRPEVSKMRVFQKKK
jgi:hypothetical protein